LTSPVSRIRALVDRPRSLRTRITGWYGAILALCIVSYSLAIGFSFQRHLDGELDQSVHEDLELASRALHLDGDGRPVWPAGFLGGDVAEEEGGGHWVEVWSRSGALLLASGTLDPHLIGPPASDVIGRGPRTERTPAGTFRVTSEPVRVGGGEFHVRAAVSEAPRWRATRSLWTEVVILSFATIAVGCIGGILLARRALGPLSRMAAHASRITADRLDERLPPGDSGRELNQLRDAFNETLGRLQTSFERLRRFTADASHELRTPLTALRTVGEVALRGQRSGEEYREVIGAMLEESDRLSGLVDDLLVMARADSSRIHPERVDLAALGREVVDGLSVLAEERRQTLEIHAEGPVPVTVEEVMVRQAITNLVDNAIKYSPEGSRIRFSVGTRTGAAVVEVRDEGPGIPSELRERIFDRFYRLDASRSRGMGGSGLGLAIARAGVEAHGGRIEVESEDGAGSLFRIVLPAADR
jgi:heavy metal sensor kinase